MQYPGGRAARWLFLEIENWAFVTPFFRWMPRTPAVQCHGTIEFYELDSLKRFMSPMPVKWPGKSLQTVPLLKVNDQTFLAIDPSDNFTVGNIYPGEKQKICIAARFVEDEDCYGWTWETEDKKWPNPDFKLKHKNYIAKIILKTSTEKFTEFVRIINEVPFNEFRLEKILESDKKTIREIGKMV